MIKGQWIVKDDKPQNGYLVAKCSCCGGSTLFINRDPSEHCPNCGASMHEDEQSEPERIQLIDEDDSVPMKFIDEFIREYYGKWQATSLGAMLSAWKERKARYVKDENDQEELSEKLEV